MASISLANCSPNDARRLLERTATPSVRSVPERLGPEDRRRTSRIRTSSADRRRTTAAAQAGRIVGGSPNSGPSVRVRLSSQNPGTLIIVRSASHSSSEVSVSGTRVITGPK